MKHLIASGIVALLILPTNITYQHLYKILYMRYHMRFACHYRLPKKTPERVLRMHIKDFHNLSELIRKRKCLSTFSSDNTSVAAQKHVMTAQRVPEHNPLS